MGRKVMIMLLCCFACVVFAAELKVESGSETSLKSAQEKILGDNPNHEFEMVGMMSITNQQPQNFVIPRHPLIGRPLVQHLVGGKLVPEQQNDGPRSIILSPSFGPTSGGVWVQIMGAGSYHTPNSLQCKLDLVEQFCYSNHYMYSWCYLTPKCAGVYPFKCHNGPLEFEGKYAVVAKTPWVTSLYPFSGDTTGGTPITVRGWNFEPHCPKNLLCKFGDQVVPAKYYTSSSIMCIAPCAAQKGFVSVEVSNDGGQHWSMSGVQYGFVGDNVDLGTGDCQRYLSSEYHAPKSLH